MIDNPIVSVIKAHTNDNLDLLLKERSELIKKLVVLNTEIAQIELYRDVMLEGR